MGILGARARLLWLDQEAVLSLTDEVGDLVFQVHLLPAVLDLVGNFNKCLESLGSCLGDID